MILSKPQNSYLQQYELTYRTKTDIFIKSKQIDTYFVCQKSLLTQGSIEEFENSFADKLLRL